MTTIIGTSSNDTLDGTANNDLIYGLGGDDTLNGQGGDDVLSGGAGDDHINGGSGINTVTFYDATQGVTVDLSAPTPYAVGQGQDTLTGISNIIGSNYDDTLIGDANNNAFSGGGGNDTMQGGGGNDMFLPGTAGNDIIDGGTGMNSLYYANFDTGINVNLGTGLATFTEPSGSYTDTISNIQAIYGSKFNDTLTGDANMNTFYGMGGNDTMQGGGGNDMFVPGVGNDNIDGGTGTNTLLFTTFDTGVNIDLSTNQATFTEPSGSYTDTLTNIQNVMGSQFNDTFIGDANNNAFSSGGGNDTMQGGGGNDMFLPGTGNDIIDGGTGINSIYYANFDTGVNVNLGTGQATFTEPSGSYTDTLSNIQMVYGSKFNDTLIGDANMNTLFSMGGNDTMQGGGGNDMFVPGVGNDNIDGGTGTNTLLFTSFDTGVNVNLSTNQATFTEPSGSYTDTLTNIQNVMGGQFNDTFIGDANNNAFSSGGGNDTMQGGGGNDMFLPGTTGNDIIDGGTGMNTIYYANFDTGVNVNLGTGQATFTEPSGSYTDTLSNIQAIYGSKFNDTLIGDANMNTFYSMGGNDTMQGGGGNDMFVPGVGNDNIDGGTGTNTLLLTSFDTGVNVDLSANQATFTEPSGSHTDTLTNIQNVMGGQFNDTFIGDANNNAFSSGGGNDTMQGGGGNDMFLPGTTGNDVIDGGTGMNSIYYANFDTGVNVNLGTGLATFTEPSGSYTDTLSNIQTVYGSQFNDTLIGDANMNTLYGMGGNDTMQGGGGNDLFIPGVGNDSIDGGTGVNTVTYASFNVPVNVNLSLGQATFTEPSGSYTDTLTNIQNVMGGQSNDTLIGDANDNAFSSGGGNDTMQGGGGNDIFVPGTTGNNIIDGGTGMNSIYYANFDTAVNINLSTGQATFTEPSGSYTDTLSNIGMVYGSNFNDTITSDANNNTFIGEGGSDTFVFLANSAKDTINDFTPNTDVMNISAYGYADFAALSSHITNDASGNAVIQLDANDSITLAGVNAASLNGSDFIF